jgi:hypothetical protein
MDVALPSVVPGSRPGRVRLCATVSYRNGASEEYWFDVPEEYEPDLSRSGDPWLTCLAPLAVTLGEPLRLRAPADAVLLENVDRVMQVWHSWYRKLVPVRIEAQVAQTRRENPQRTAAYFSGGVDSFFTVLREENRHEAGPAIDDLLYVDGFYLYLQDPAARLRVRDRLAAAADTLGKRFIDVGTNLRDTRWAEARWARLSFGSGLAAAGLCLADRYRSLLIASSNDTDHLQPWGSHPETDPLHSTGTTKVFHDGVEFTRLEKISVVAESEAARRSLYVCGRLSDSENCGRCEKCVVTMTALELYAGLGSLETFREPTLAGVRLDRIFVSDASGDVSLRQLRDLARDLGRPKYSRLIEHSLRRSRILRPAVSLSRSLRQVERLQRGAGLAERMLLYSYHH